MLLRKILLPPAIGIATLAIGDAAAQTVTISPATLTFNQVAQNSGLAFGSSTISFSGDPGGVVNLSSLFQTDGPFTGQPGTCPTNLSNGASCSFIESLKTTTAGVFDVIEIIPFSINGTSKVVNSTLELKATVAPVPEPPGYVIAFLGMIGITIVKGLRRSRDRDMTFTNRS